MRGGRHTFQYYEPPEPPSGQVDQILSSETSARLRLTGTKLGAVDAFDCSAVALADPVTDTLSGWCTLDDNESSETLSEQVDECHEWLLTRTGE